MRRVRILPPQPGSPAPGNSTLSDPRNARQWRAFANWRLVSELRIWRFQRKIADSLRLIFEIFPFLGDGDRRPGSIYSAWPVWHGIVRFADAPKGGERVPP